MAQCQDYVGDVGPKCQNCVGQMCQNYVGSWKILSKLCRSKLSD